MSYTFEVIRDLENSTTTLSTNKLINDTTGEILFKGVGLEPGGPSTTASGMNKRIIAGDYRLTFTDSARNASFSRKYPEKWNPIAFFKKYPQYLYSKNSAGRNVTLWCINGTNFDHRRILLHVGNTAKDTRGCYLLGKWRNVNNFTISNSLVALDEFYSIVLKIGVENIRYVIKDSF